MTNNYLTDEEIRLLKEQEKIINEELKTEARRDEKKVANYLNSLKDSDNNSNKKKNLNQYKIDDVVISMEATDAIKKLAEQFSEKGQKEIENIEKNIESEIEKLSEILDIVRELNKKDKK